MELLLLSNSTLLGKAWLEHALPTIAGQLNGRRSAVFIPFAGVTQTWDDYTAKTAAVFGPMGVAVTGIHSVADPVSAIENAEIVIVGGGNTFQLLKECRERGLLEPMVDVVKRGALYVGWSARGLTLPARPSAPLTICRLSTLKALMLWGCSRYKLTRISPTPYRKAIKAKPVNSAFASCWWLRRN